MARLLNPFGMIFGACLTLASAALVGAGAPRPPGWTPSRELIELLEKRVVLRSDAYPFHRYRRSYVGYIDKRGRRIISAMYTLQQDPKDAVIEIVKAHKYNIFDAGCSVVYLSVDEHLNWIDEPYCS